MIGNNTSEKFLFVFSAVALLLAGADNGLAQTHIPPWLTAGTPTNGQIKLTLTTEPGVSKYVIQSSPGLKNWTPVVTNNDNTNTRLITLTASATANFFRAQRDPIPVFAYALAARGNINMLGNSIETDSWNSHDPAKSTNGLYNGYSGTNGHVASVSGFVNTGNETISGNVYLGPNATYSGSGKVVGTIYSDGNLGFPDVVLPTTDTNGNAITWTPAPGTSSLHSFTNSGYYMVSDSGSLIVDPGIMVTLQLTMTSFNPGSITIKGGITNSGTIIMYQNQGSFALGGNASGGAIGSRPQNFIYYGLTNVTSVSLTGTSTFVGCIYAPEAALNLNGGLTINFVGGGVFNTITVISHYTVHFDESLLTSGPTRRNFVQCPFAS